MVGAYAPAHTPAATADYLYTTARWASVNKLDAAIARRKTTDMLGMMKICDMPNMTVTHGGGLGSLDAFKVDMTHSDDGLDLEPGDTIDFSGNALEEFGSLFGMLVFFTFGMAFGLDALARIRLGGWLSAMVAVTS